MSSVGELKSIFQNGWNIPARVNNYVRSVAQGEFQDPDSLGAWRRCLETALPAGLRLRILDVGTGPGVFACLYAQMGHQCVGLDFSKSMLAEANRLAAELKVDCSFVFGDAEEPPLESASFDVVSSRHLLFNLPRPGVAVREWVRLLKPGGTMILIGFEPPAETRASWTARVRRWLNRGIGRFSKSRPCGWHPSADYLKAVSQCPLFRHSAGAIRAIMEAAGLENIHLHPSDDIALARRKRLPRSQRVCDPPERPPYVLVGRKPL